jgi:curved DNA-binding protein CbpA
VLRRGNSVDEPASEANSAELRRGQARHPAMAPPPGDEDDFEDRPTGLMFEEPPTGVIEQQPAPVAAAAPAAVAAPEPVPSAPPREEIPDAALQERLREVDALYDRLGELNYYQLLGLPSDADAEGVKQAYFLLARRFHPDAYFRKPIGGHRQKLELIFRMLTRAQEVLHDAQLRAQYDAANHIQKRARRTEPAPEPAPTMNKTSAVFPRMSPPVPSHPPARTGVVSTRPAASYSANTTPPAPASSAQAREAVTPAARKVSQPSLPPANKPSQPSLRPPVITESRPAPAPSAPSSSAARSLAPGRPAAREALLKSLEARRRVPTGASHPPVASSTAYGRAVETSQLEQLAEEFAKRGDKDSAWAAGQLRQAARNERAGELAAVIAMLQTVMVRVSDPRLRELRDKLHKQTLQAGAKEFRSKAMAAEQASNHREGAENWRKVLEAEPNDAKAALHAAACLIKAGDVKSAGQFAKRAVELAPNDPNARKVALRFYETMGMTANANREREALAKLTKK